MRANSLEKLEVLTAVSVSAVALFKQPVPTGACPWTIAGFDDNPEEKHALFKQILGGVSGPSFVAACLAYGYDKEYYNSLYESHQWRRGAHDAKQWLVDKALGLLKNAFPNAQLLVLDIGPGTLLLGEQPGVNYLYFDQNPLVAIAGKVETVCANGASLGPPDSVHVLSSSNSQEHPSNAHRSIVARNRGGVLLGRPGGRRWFRSRTFFLGFYFPRTKRQHEEDTTQVIILAVLRLSPKALSRLHRARCL